MSKYLCIDYGRKRIGLSFADEVGISVPIPAILGTGLEGWQDALTVVVEVRKVDELVVGYPLNMDGSVGTRAREVDVFAAELKKLFGVPVHKSDERLTTHAAVQGFNVSRKRMPSRETGELDSAAAALILRDFLEERNPSLIPNPEDFPEA